MATFAHGTRPDIKHTRGGEGLPVDKSVSHEA
jgi:hypothetical protein